VNAPSTRAKPLAAEDRKTAILEAVIPLVVERGAAVTTAEMAGAAGVAEGTIYSVFPDKATLIADAVRVALEPGPVQQALDAIDRTASFAQQLADVARVLSGRFQRAVALISVLRSLSDSAEVSHAAAHQHVVASNALVSRAVTDLLEEHVDELRVQPDRAAVAFGGLIFASGYPLLPVEQRLTIDEVVDTLLLGIARERSVDS
jgi:AcrR family transcriptional regulator